MSDSRPSPNLPSPPSYNSLELDPKFYILGEDESAFFKQQTGIRDDAELKQHLLAIQAEAYAVQPYPCIRHFAFARSTIVRLFAYDDCLKLGKERKDAILLDIGCCFGADVRRVVADGYPVQNVVTSDLHTEFWKIGHKLFKSTSETFPVPFVGGDAFDPAHLSIVPPFTTTTPPTTTVPLLHNLTSLNPLQGHVSAIHASLLFHIFPEDGQLHLARALAGLLSPQPGSMIFGQHIALPEKGTRHSSARASTSATMFCHSPDSWTELWDGMVFENGTVKVIAKLIELKTENYAEFSPGVEVYILSWCVTRL